jgi:lipopolysaccharide export system protein LptA
MGKNSRAIQYIIVLLCLVVGCAKKEAPHLEESSAMLEKFRIESLAGKVALVVTGESAEQENAGAKTVVKKPDLKISSKNSLIDITTDKTGKGELLLDPSTRKISDILLEGTIRITQKPEEGAPPSFIATCTKLIYRQNKEILIMEGSPEIVQAGNRYRADRILYDMRSGKLAFEGNVRVQVTDLSDRRAD